MPVDELADLEIAWKFLMIAERSGSRLDSEVFPFSSDGFVLVFSRVSLVLLLLPLGSHYNGSLQFSGHVTEGEQSKEREESLTVPVPPVTSVCTGYFCDDRSTQ